MNGLDLEFIRTAERVTSFNIAVSAFQNLNHKKEIQHLFNKHFFPSFDIDKTIKNIEMRPLNLLIDELKRIDSNMFSKIHNYNLKGVGPGEVTLYFLVETCRLGGGSSAGVDVLDSVSKYEVKAVKLTPDRVASDFKLGGTAPLSGIIQDLNTIRERLKLGGTRTEMSGSIMADMRRMAPAEFNAIESRYSKIAYDYFKGHDVIFINNSPSKLGRIEAIKEVNLKDVSIERVTSGTVKPKIKL